jgi:uncharacterized protein involved in exopolysaccharide biosynthesis
MAALTQRPGMPLWSDYTGFARRHLVLFVTLMGLGALTGFAWSSTLPASYSATASVALVPVPVYVTDTSAELVPPEVSIDTDAQLLQSPEVLGAIGAELGVGEEAAGEHLLVTASPNSHVLHVTVRADSARVAARAANAAVTALAEVRRQALGSLQRSQLRQLRWLAQAQEDVLAEEQVRRVVIPNREDLFAQIVQLRASLHELEQARTDPIDVARPAEEPRRSDYANTEVPVTSGAMVGLLCACLLGALRDRRRSRTPSEPPSNHLTSVRAPDDAIRHEEYEHAI